MKTKKGPYILHSKVEQSITKKRSKKARRNDDDVRGDVLKLLGEDNLKIMTQLINNMHETGQQPKEFIEVTMMALKRKPEPIKQNNYCTVSLIAYTAKMVARILRRRTERKIEDVLGGDYFGFGGAESRFAIGMLRIISELILETDYDLCACFIDWQKALQV